MQSQILDREVGNGVDSAERANLAAALKAGAGASARWVDAMDQPLPENPDAWWLRLQRHGFVAGNMLTTTVETDRLYARARERRHSA